MRYFWLSVPFGCGAVATNDEGIIVGGCPLFRSAFGGLQLNAVMRRYRSAKCERI